MPLQVGCVPKMPLTPMRFLKFWLMPGWCTWYRKDGPSAKPDMVRAMPSRDGPADCARFEATRHLAALPRSVCEG